MKRLLIGLGIIGLIVLSIVAWRSYRYTYTDLATYGEIAGRRYERAKTADSIKIAVIWPQEKSSRASSLWNGVRQARDQINNRVNPLQDGSGNPIRDAGQQPYYHQHPVNTRELEDGRPVCKGLPIKVRTRTDNGTEGSEIRCMKIELQNIAPRSNKDELEAARQVARDPRFVAVIGHSSNDIAKFAAVSYQQTDLLFFSVNVTDPALTNHNFKYVFRTIPEDYEMAKAVVKMIGEFRGCNGLGAERQGRVGIFYARSAYAMNAVATITASMGEIDKNLDYVFEKSYDLHLSPPAGSRDGGIFSPLTELFGNPARGDALEIKRKNLRDLIDEVKIKYSDNPPGPSGPPEPSGPSGFDSLLLVDDQADRAGEVLSLIRSRGIAKPVIAGASLDDQDFYRDSVIRQIYGALSSFCQGAANASPAAQFACPPAQPAFKNLQNITLVASVFDPASPENEIKKFVEKYQENNQERPDFIAAQGYEAMMILAQAFERSESIAPIDVADVLRSQGPFTGLTEKVCFTPEGDIRGKRIYLKVFQEESKHLER